MSGVEVTNLVLLALNLVLFVATNLYVKAVYDMDKLIEQCFKVFTKEREEMEKKYDLVDAQYKDIMESHRLLYGLWKDYKKELLNEER